MCSSSELRAANLPWASREVEPICSALLLLHQRGLGAALLGRLDGGRRLLPPNRHRLGAVLARGAHLRVRCLVVDGVHDAWGHGVRALLNADVRGRLAAGHLRDARHAARVLGVLTADASARGVVRALPAVARTADLRLLGGVGDTRKADDASSALGVTKTRGREVARGDRLPNRVQARTCARNEERGKDERGRLHWGRWELLGRYLRDGARVRRTR